jgi:hypothetical protein
MTPDPKHWTANHLISPQKWNKYNYVQNNPLLRFDPNGMDDYVVFRTVTAGTNGAAWSAAEKSITSQKDSHGNYNTFHMVEGNNATVGAFNKALSTPGTHVVFVGHTVHEPGKTTPYGVGLSNGESSGKNGSTTVGMTETPSATPGEPPSLSMSIDATSSASVSASSVALFGCNSYDLASQYSGTDFTGVQSGANGTEAETLDSAAAAWVGAGGGQAGDTAANGAIDASQYPVDTGDNVESEQPATNPNDNASAPPHSN